MNVSTTLNSEFGNAAVRYGQNASSLIYTDQSQFDDFISVDPFPIPKSQSLNPVINLYATSSWYAQACYSGNFSSTCSSVVHFTINPASLPSATTSAIIAQQINNTPQILPSSTISSTIGINPYTCQGIFLNVSVSECASYLMFSFAQILFQPTTGAQDLMSQSVQDIESAPPFQGVFTTIEDLQSAVSSTPANADLGYNLTLDSEMSGTVPFMNSSTMSGAVTPAGKTFLFNLEDAVFSLLDLELIFFVPWHWWRRKHDKPHA